MAKPLLSVSGRFKSFLVSGSPFGRQKTDSNRRRLVGGVRGGGRVVVVNATAGPLASSGILAERRQRWKRSRRVVLL